MNTISKLAAAATCALALAACGGGGGDATPPKPSAFIYEGLPVAADATSFLAQVNQEGAKGYRYLYNESFNISCPSPCPPAPPSVSVFLNDGTAASYTYELLPTPNDVASFITQANTEGAKGYQYAGWYGVESMSSNPGVGTPSYAPPPYAFYRKDSGSTATYTYVVDTVKMGGAGIIDDFLSQANTRGRSGYWFYGQIGNGTYFPLTDLYVKNNASNEAYTYEVVQTDITSFPISLDELNSKGARGYRLAYSLQAGNTEETSTAARLYMKDQAQSATFIFQQTKELPATDGTALITRLNSHGAQGYANSRKGDYWYFKATNCSGWLCTTFNPPMEATNYIRLSWYGLD
jgi:hypothetical protein